MNKEQCQQLIDKLEDKSLLQFYDADTREAFVPCEAPPRPVTIGRVFDLMDSIPIEEMIENDTFYEMPDPFLRLVFKWRHCGFTKALDEIMGKSGFIQTECIDPECKCGKFPLRNDSCPYKQQLKNPNTRELFEFLHKIFNE